MRRQNHPYAGEFWEPITVRAKYKWWEHTGGLDVENGFFETSLDLLNEEK